MYIDALSLINKYFMIHCVKNGFYIVPTLKGVERMKLEEIKQYYGKNVIITFNDGHIRKGFFCSFTWGDDNENGIESITIESENEWDIEIYLNEIKSIEAVK
jgi:hypothetical protein